MINAYCIWLITNIFFIFISCFTFVKIKKGSPYKEAYKGLF